MAKVHDHRWKVDHQPPPLPPDWYCRIYLSGENPFCTGPIRISRCRRSRCREIPASPVKGNVRCSSCPRTNCMYLFSLFPFFFSLLPALFRVHTCTLRTISVSFNHNVLSSLTNVKITVITPKIVTLMFPCNWLTNRHRPTHHQHHHLQPELFKPNSYRTDKFSRLKEVEAPTITSTERT